MNKIIFEEKGAEILRKIGMTKTEFAEKMGIKKQNVNALFKTHNLSIIRKAATVMNVPFEMLVGYSKEPDIFAMDPVPIVDGVMPLSSGEKGNVFDFFAGRPREAFWFLVNNQKGELKDVFYRTDIGGINLVWGNDICGVCRVLMWQIKSRFFSTVNEMIDTITNTAIKGTVLSDNDAKLLLGFGTFRLEIVRDTNWILSDFYVISGE